jgi:hypothetical protein
MGSWGVSHGRPQSLFIEPQKNLSITFLMGLKLEARDMSGARLMHVLDILVRFREL